MQVRKTDRQLHVRDDVDEQLLPLLLEEADELLPKISVGLSDWHEQPHDKKRLLAVSRLLHTLKGSARMAGAMFIGELAHGIEDRVQIVAQRLDQPEYWAALKNDFDHIADLIEALRAGKVPVAISNSGEQHLSGSLRMGIVPFSCISERLYRIVRQTGKELGKRANLELSGTNVELDRSVLDKMTAPFEHLLRNAIAHGIETPQQREYSGKPAIGEIHLSLRQESKELVFELSDDGAGLDMACLQKLALASGLLHKGEELSPEHAIKMIFTPGISTAREVTEISGRGVGLDVVSSEVSALGGRLDVVSRAGKGVCFTIYLPRTLEARE
jgi:chemotaxis protein histidine kinase CheA